MAADAATPIDIKRQIEVARRVKAARGYAGLSQSELASYLGIADATMKRSEKGDAKLIDRIDTVARVCELPMAFFTIDFNRLPELEQEPDVSEVGELREGLRSLTARVAELQADVTTLATEVRQRTVQDETPTQDRPPQ